MSSPDYGISALAEVGAASDSSNMTVVYKTHFRRTRNKVELKDGEAPPVAMYAPVFRTPRITKFMALAIHLQNLIDEGAVCDYSQIASLSGLSRARISQIMNLNLLAPRIQEEILFMPKIAAGVDPISECDLRTIALKPLWEMQLKDWLLLLK